MRNSELISYLVKGVERLLAQGSFDGGQPLRRTQKQTLEAYKRYLENDALSIDDRLKGFFEIPTGIGKTAIFVGIVASAHRVAKSEGQAIKSIIVVPSVQLLYQTQKSFTDFAPDTQNSIGLYGDGHKSYRQPISIMTYNAWYDLSQAGTINSQSVDILISDEAHRGTSERRIENILKIFNEKVAQIAFTATAHFDEEKSVQTSHEREIFYKSISDGIREDELAAYIQSHRAVIRVAPTKFMLSDEFQEATKQEKAKYRQRIRQKAWNEFAVKAYRDGRDEITGDSLTDNQAGFFVEGIEQADELEQLLNADPTLQGRARDGGYKGVALAIHSRLSPAEQRARFKAYKNGEYMAVVGDEKFKEGFDHAPMKTIIDVPHASLVDKAQILGRGARKWWNEKKQRFEGLTIIDTVIYVGSNDTDIDKAIRDAALRGSIAVKDILEDSLVISEAEKKRERGGLGIGTAVNIFADDEDVEYYSSVEDIYRLESEISKLRRENYIEITDEMREELNAEAERTGIGSAKLCQKEGTPEGLTVTMINAWRSGATRVASLERWDWVISIYKSLVSADTLVEITHEMRTRLNVEFERTGIGSKRLCQIEGAPQGLTASTINDWRRRMTQTAILNHYNWVISAYQSIESLVNITSKEQEALNAEFERTGVGSLGICRIEGVPEGLNAGLINRWRNGLTRTALAEHWNWVMAAYQSLESEVRISDQMRDALNAEAERTGIGATKLCQMKDVPEGLNYSTVKNWRAGSCKTGQLKHWNWVMSTYQSLPSALPALEVSNEMLEKLNAEIERSGISPSQLCKNNNMPEGLNISKIYNWLAESAKTTQPEHWNWVMSRYAELPDAAPKSEPTTQVKTPRSPSP